MDILLYASAASELLGDFGRAYDSQGCVRYEQDRPGIEGGFRGNWNGRLNGELEVLVRGCEEEFDRFTERVTGSPNARTWGGPDDVMLGRMVQGVLVKVAVPKIVSEFSSSGKKAIAVYGNSEGFRAQVCAALIGETGGRYFVRGFDDLEEAKTWSGEDTYLVDLETKKKED